MPTNNEEQQNIVEKDGVIESVSYDVPATTKKRANKVDKIINVALWIVIAVLIVLLVLRLFVFSSIRVKGESMSPTYNTNDIVTVSKVSQPQRGDVVVFYKYDVDNKLAAMFASKELKEDSEAPYAMLIKRVVALSGDKLWVRTVGGQAEVYELVIQTADGQILTENYYVKKGTTLEVPLLYNDFRATTKLGLLEGHTEANPLVVSEGCFFALGDHRINSSDSRSMGEIPLARLYGVVLDK